MTHPNLRLVDRVRTRDAIERPIASKPDPGRLVSLEAWISLHFGAGAPSVHTVRRWCREGRMDPPAQQLGRAYYVHEHARYKPADHAPTPQGSVAPALAT